MSGVYALVDGRWIEAVEPDGDEPILLRWRGSHPPEGFGPAGASGIHLAEMPQTRVERLVTTTTRAHVGRVGPFRIHPAGPAARAGTVVAVYEGSDADSALALPGFVRGDRQLDGGEIRGVVAASDLRDVTISDRDLALLGRHS